MILSVSIQAAHPSTLLSCIPGAATVGGNETDPVPGQVCQRGGRRGHPYRADGDRPPERSGDEVKGPQSSCHEDN